jgi:hypothetical protein
MAVTTVLLSALAFSLPLAFASPIETANQTLEARGCTYGGPWWDFPPMSEWLPWGDIFNNYEQSMVDAGSSWDDVGRIAVAIEQAAADIGVDERVILGIILQESSGYVGVPCTGGGADCGIMQCEGCASFPYQNELPQVRRVLPTLDLYLLNITSSPIPLPWSMAVRNTSRQI